MARKILVVDDNQDTLNILGAVLRKGGYDTLFAKDGLEAIQKAREASPALILLDIMMPRMDGLEVLRILKGDAAYARTPILVVTAKTDPLSKNQSLELGASDYLIKPIDPGEILRTIKHYIGDDEPPASSSAKPLFISLFTLLAQ